MWPGNVKLYCLHFKIKYNVQLKHWVCDEVTFILAAQQFSLNMFLPSAQVVYRRLRNGARVQQDLWPTWLLSAIPCAERVWAPWALFRIAPRNGHNREEMLSSEWICQEAKKLKLHGPSPEQVPSYAVCLVCACNVHYIILYYTYYISTVHLLSHFYSHVSNIIEVEA